MLEVLGYTSEVAVDGAAAAARVTGGRFDAVLMDLQMPRLDGFAATRLIRQAEPPGVHVPIIALTASATAGEQEQCLAAGMDGFLAKPVGAEALGRVLREHLTGEAAAAPDPDRPPTAAGTTAPPPPDGDAPVLDTDRLDELAEMGTTALPLIQRAIDNFVDGTGAHIDALRGALDSGDAPAARSAAHRLKGSAANLGALRVAALAFELERLGEDGELDEAPAVLDELASALEAAAAELESYRFRAGTSAARSA
jgi:CheY-like chemotaxis protein